MTTVLEGVASALVQRYLAPYTARLKSTGLARLGPKQIHDTIWGTIALRPLEVAVLDSPLMQRLRHLRQLGVAHWVYPGADHSRFEHSLGVLHQTQQLISAINRAGLNRYNEIVISDDDEQLLRVSALLHDTGHPVLSHVSEYALRLDPTILLEVQRERKAVGEKVSISELVSAKIVSSTAFQEFFEVVATEHRKLNLRTTDWAANPESFAQKVSKVILGQNVSSSVPLLHEIVSGPYDADKLDYMVRDAMAAGIPSIIDISRLVQKLTVVRYTSRELPQQVARLVPQSTREAYLFGFPWSGLSVIDELLLARMMLYAKLYRHPKVAGLESIVQSFLDQVALLIDPTKVILFIYDVLDDQLLLSGRSELLAKFGLTDDGILEDPTKQRSLEICVELLRRLRERELFVRGFAFFAGHPENGHEADSQAFDKLVKHISDQTKRDDLHRKIVAEVKTIMQLLGLHNEMPSIYNFIDEVVVLRILAPPSQKELRHAWIFPTGGSPRTYEKTSIHKEAWSSSFVSASAKGYLFCPKEIAQVVFMAAEAVIATEFGVAVPEWMMEETKLSAELLKDSKLALRRLGYYRGRPKIIRPRWPRLSMNDVENTVTRFAERFSVVQETVSPALSTDEDHNGFAKMKKRAYAWLDQFGDESEIESALVLLEQSRLVSRQDVVGALRTFISANPSFGTASVVALSKGNDSSQIVQYFSADVGSRLVFYGSLKDAVDADRPDPVLIVDDFCGSGGQWVNTIGSLFEDASLKRPELNEQRRLGLEPEKDYLRDRPSGFVFTAGWKDGETLIASAAAKVGMDTKVYVHLSEDVLPFAQNILLSERGPDDSARFLERAGAVGEGLLRGNEPKWSEEQIQDRKLGYGNRAMLLFFPYNAPSQTLTCMWADGDVDGERWEPLVKRRKKT